MNVRGRQSRKSRSFVLVSREELENCLNGFVDSLFRFANPLYVGCFQVPPCTFRALSLSKYQSTWKHVGTEWIGLDWIGISGVRIG